MDIAPRFHHALRRAATAVLALGLSAAFAQGVAAPDRVARFEATEGSVQFQAAADGQTRLADPRWPLTTGDRVWTAVGSRAELHAGSATVRLGEGSDFAITQLEDRSTQLRLTSGTLGVEARDLFPGERFEIDTPNLALVLDRPGRWRIDVDAGRNTTRVSAEQGSGTLYGENGQSLPFVAPQSRDFAFRTLAESAPLANRYGDAFDRWSAERDRVLAQSQSIRYASAAIPGVTQLDSYGDWGNDPGYGAIWYPRGVASSWTPYSQGRWEWISPWGWTWVDDAPWGFAPFHYGRWAQTGNRWGWVPGPARGGRPAFAPAPPFTGARPRVPDNIPPQGRFVPPAMVVPQRIGASIEPLADQVRRDQWERTQRARQDQYQADMQRQQQQREAQQRFQPGFGQRQLDDQRRQIEHQQQQLMFQQQRQQQEALRQQQGQQQQQMQVQQQQRQQQMQMEQQQRQMQADQQRQQLQQVQQQQHQLQQQQQQIMQRPGLQLRNEQAPPQAPNNPGPRRPPGPPNH